MKCPKCGYENSDGASVCKSCYFDLKSTTQPVTPRPVNNATKQKAPSPVPPAPAQPTVSMPTPPPQPTYSQPAASQPTPGAAPPGYAPPAPGGPAAPAGAFPGASPMPSMMYMDYVAFWPRVGARLIDALLMGVLVFVIYSVTGVMGAITSLFPPKPGMTPDQFQFLMKPVIARIQSTNSFIGLLELVYFIGMTSALGATLGKMAVGAKIVKENGSPIGVGIAIGRYLLQTIFAMLTCGLAYIAVAVSPTKQGWHDKIMGTVVIHNR